MEIEWSPAAIGAVYSGVAPALVDLLREQSDRDIERLVAVRSRLGPGAKLLDVGCGFGRDVEWFARQGIAAFGIDPSEGMLAAAAPTFGPLPLFRGDLLSVPAPWLGTFDCCWCRGMFFHISAEEQPLALRMLRDLVIPGGFVYLQMSRGRGISLRRICTTTGEAPYSFLSDADLSRLANESALELVRDYSTERDHALLYRRVDEQAIT